jgi:hypothetical protein
LVFRVIHTQILFHSCKVSHVWRLILLGNTLDWLLLNLLRVHKALSYLLCSFS